MSVSSNRSISLIFPGSQKTADLAIDVNGACLPADLAASGRKQMNNEFWILALACKTENDLDE